MREREKERGNESESERERKRGRERCKQREKGIKIATKEKIYPDIRKQKEESNRDNGIETERPIQRGSEN